MIRALAPYLLLAVLAAGGAWYVQGIRSANEELRASVDAMEREARVAKAVAEQAKLAREVERATVRRLQADLVKLNEIRDWIHEGDDNAPMPDLLRDVFERLLGDDNN